MSNKARHKKKCLCEKSKKMVVNIIKLSALSLASLSFRTTMRLPKADRNHVSVTGKVAAKNVPPVPQLPGKQGSRELESSSKPQSYLIEPEKKGSSYMIREINDIDEKASDYIRRIHEKNQNDWNNASKRFSYILLPPPPVARNLPSM